MLGDAARSAEHGRGDGLHSLPASSGADGEQGEGHKSASGSDQSDALSALCGGALPSSGAVLERLHATDIREARAQLDNAIE